ncbi:MAG TPA: M50 family metallopeptidase [Nitrososphaeraceae archaeon]|nr:M50 family metallopeptidase [Nitrososphaeraceae archaeon]
MIHTPFGMKLFDWVARTNAAKIYAKSNRYLMPFITALMLFLLISSVIAIVSFAPAREMSRDLGPRSIFLIPILNPYLPVGYVLISLIITIVVHEAGHGIVARVYNVKIESTGVVFFFVVPIGAFVNIEQKELEKTPLKFKSSILTAGVLNNMVLAGISLFGLYLVVSSLYPLPVSGGEETGVIIDRVNKGSLAEKIHLTEGSVIQTISGQNVRSIEDLRKLLQSNLGKTIEMTWAVKNKPVVRGSVTLPSSVNENKGILGVTISTMNDPKTVLNDYKSWFSGTSALRLITPPTILEKSVPYSDLMADRYDSSIFGSSYAILANMFFWLWFINFNVAIFNALPIGPLDGGQLYGSFIASRTKQKTAEAISSLVTFIMILVIFMTLVFPYVL